MKKTIPAPENWQDFESLCKKLFGEIWGCQFTIKKNGRLGQYQSGVDIYGKPKGEIEYWGIQCKGKDNYSNAKLNEKEIEIEIEKAQKFEPRLKTLIFATTAPKDAEIEKFIRKKDCESKNEGSFQIILYCWQDIVDLLYENRETYNWYVNERQFKDKYDVDISFYSSHNDEVLKPKFQINITDYVLKKESNIGSYEINFISNSNPFPFEINPTLLGANKKNHGWTSFSTSIKNTGSIVIEEWKLWLTFYDDVQKIDDNFPKDIYMYEKLSKHRTSWAFEKENKILYEPIDRASLIQKDSRTFESFCIPKFESNEVKIQWELLARDFHKTGEYVFKVETEYETKHKTVYVDKIDEVRSEKVISEYITIE